MELSNIDLQQSGAVDSLVVTAPVPSRRFTRMIALGRDCQTAFQVRRVTGQQQQGYFDWVETPHRGLVSTLKCGLDLPFQKQNLCLTEDQQGIFDRRTGFTHRYLFQKRKDQDTLSLEVIEQEYGKQKAILTLLARMWRELVNSERVLLVRQDQPTEKQALELYDAIAPYTSAHGFALLYVTPPGGAFVSPRDGIFIEEGPPLSSEPGAWRGNDEGWNAALEKHWRACD